MKIETAFLQALNLPEDKRLKYWMKYQKTIPYSGSMFFSSLLNTWVHYLRELEYENSTRKQNGGTVEYTMSFYKESGGVMNEKFSLWDIYDFKDSLYEYYKLIILKTDAEVLTI